MKLFWLFFTVIIGFSLLFYGAKFLCDGGTGLAAKSKLSPLLISMTVVSLSTSAPECISVLVATFNGYHEMALANLVGSNFANMALGYGLAAIIIPFPTNKRLGKIELPLLILASFILLATSHVFGYTPTFLGTIFLISIAIYICFSIKTRHSIEHSDEIVVSILSKFKSITFILIGCCALFFGSNFVINSCAKLAEIFNLSHSFVGFSILALGTSLPEIFISIISVLKKHPSICIGNIIGANLINLFCIGGISLLCGQVSCNDSLIKVMIPAYIFVLLSTAIIFLTSKKVSRIFGVFLITAYFVTIYYSV